MDNFLDSLRNSASRPIRRIASAVVHPDSRTGAPRELVTEAQETLLSSDGSPDTIAVKVAQVYEGCHHSVELPLGGQCLVCNRLSCSTCHSQCADCRKPLCLGCCRFEGEAVEVSAPRCRECHEARERRRCWRFLLSPFVTWKAEERR